MHAGPDGSPMDLALSPDLQGAQDPDAEPAARDVVLVVDSDPYYADAICGSLEAAGYTVVHCGTADGAMSCEGSTALPVRGTRLAILGPHRVGDLDVIRRGTLTIDLQRRQVTVSGSEVHLTRKEFTLLVSLARRPGAVLSRERLIQDVWGEQDDVDPRGVDSHVKRLRKKLGPAMIKTVHGVGYSFTTGEQKDG